MVKKFIPLLFFLLCRLIPVIAGNIEGEHSVIFNNMEVHHQGVNKLNIKITYRYKQNIIDSSNFDFIKMQMKVDSTLRNYSNTTDWWEIVNKNLTSLLMKTFESIDSLASDIEVNWVSGAGVEYGHRYPTRSVTARTRKGKLYEYFGFRTLPDYNVIFKEGFREETIHVDVLYEYVPGIADKDYPDGLETENLYKKELSQLAARHNSFDNNYSWDALNKEVCHAMLDKYHLVQGIISSIEIDEPNLEGSIISSIQLKRAP